MGSRYFLAGALASFQETTVRTGGAGLIATRNSAVFTNEAGTAFGAPILSQREITLKVVQYYYNQTLFSRMEARWVPRHAVVSQEPESPHQS